MEAPVDQGLLTRRYTDRARFHPPPPQRPFFCTSPIPCRMSFPQYASPDFAGKSRTASTAMPWRRLDWSTGRSSTCCVSWALPAVRGRLHVRQWPRPESAKPNPNSRFPGRSSGGAMAHCGVPRGVTFEGGIRVPCLAWWPGTVPAGRMEASPVSALDLFPDLRPVARAVLPADRTLDGEDIGPFLQGKPSSAGPRAVVRLFRRAAPGGARGPGSCSCRSRISPNPRPEPLVRAPAPACSNASIASGPSPCFLT